LTFEEFVRTRVKALLRYAAVVTCDPHLGEDITQDVLVRAQARWSRIGGLDAPESYVKRMIVNEFLSWRRRLETRTVPLARESLEHLAGTVPDPTGPMDQRDAVVQLLAGLPPKQRAVLALRFYEDLPVAEIAEILGCRPVTVRTHMARALETLRDTVPAPLTTAKERS
jgi:RNA polymerase sigma-70 factor (sigma-E family)